MPTVLMTGATNGLGREAIRFIAGRGGVDILLTGRSPEAMEELARELRRGEGVGVHLLPLDTSSMASVRAAAAETRRLLRTGAVGPLATLVLNAGMQPLGAAEFTPEGFEETFATNCLGHFLLLNLLLDDVADGGRVVWTASGTHDPDTLDGRLVGKAAPPDAEALAFAGRGAPALPGGVRYTSSKLCVLLYSYELDRRLRREGRDVASIAFDPGYVPGTALLRRSSFMAQRISKSRLFTLLFRLLGGTVGALAFSGSALGRIAVDEGYRRASGRYIQSDDFHLREAQSSRASHDEAAAAKLWRDSSRLVGFTPEGGGAVSS